jgi:glycosyltransferase involved in cell wall biosynthesis
MRILHIFVSNGIGGAEKLIANYISSNLNVLQNTILCKKGSFSFLLEKKGLQFVSYTNLLDLIFKLKKYKNHVFHCHDPKAALFASMFRNDLILHIHGNHTYLRSLNIKNVILKLFILPKSFKILWISNEALKAFYYYEFVKERSLILYNFIDIKKIPINNLPIENRKYDLILLGRLARIKQPHKFLYLVKEIILKHPIKCLIVGTGPLSSLIKKEIANLSLESVVDFVGYTQDIYKYLFNSKILVNLSISEGFPLTFLEAAWAKVVIAHTQGENFLSEFMDSKSSIVTNEISTVSDLIIYHLENPWLLEQLADLSQTRFKKQFSVIDFSNKLFSIYELFKKD